MANQTRQKSPLFLLALYAINFLIIVHIELDT